MCGWTPPQRWPAPSIIERSRRSRGATRSANRCLTADDRRSSGLLITTGLGLYRKQHQPEAGYDFGDGHRRPAVLERRCVFGKDQTAKTHDRYDDRRKYAERRQDPGNISRSEKQIEE